MDFFSPYTSDLTFSVNWDKIGCIFDLEILTLPQSRFWYLQRFHIVLTRIVGLTMPKIEVTSRLKILLGYDYYGVFELKADIIKNKHEVYVQLKLHNTMTEAFGFSALSFENGERFSKQTIKRGTFASSKFKLAVKGVLQLKDRSISGVVALTIDLKNGKNIFFLFPVTCLSIRFSHSIRSNFFQYKVS